MTDANELLPHFKANRSTRSSARENRIFAVADDHVLVWDNPVPPGKPVPLTWVQDAIDRLEHGREIEISVASLRYRSAFIGAVLERSRAPPSFKAARRKSI